MTAGSGYGTQIAFSIAPAFVREGLASQNIARYRRNQRSLTLNSKMANRELEDRVLGNR